MARHGEKIRKRKDGRWEGRYKIGNDENGRTMYASVYGKSYAETKEKLKVAETIKYKSMHKNNKMMFSYAVASQISIHQVLRYAPPNRKFVTSLNNSLQLSKEQNLGSTMEKRFQRKTMKNTKPPLLEGQHSPRCLERTPLSQS